MTEEDKTELQKAWDELILEFGKALKLDKIVNWMSKILNKYLS